MTRSAYVTLWMLALASAAGCMSHVAAYRRGWDSPSGKLALDVVGLSGLGQPYTGVNDKYADTFIYERASSSKTLHLTYHRKIPIHNIGDMEVECQWSDDRAVRLIFYDYGDWDTYTSKTPRPQRRFVTSIFLQSTQDGSWNYKTEIKKSIHERPQQPN
ncbi:MAG: hypothetical protein A2283_07815 [Lentisphaerae bacterium RIFOXYA12_FULL_48_11]|nr:MAG: hypothetical protein A2283_07815 [Lentisphaerae bacterium RIFOXYA12_FULL_48_11]